MLLASDQREDLWTKMPAFTALNGGAGSPRTADGDVGGSIEVRLPPTRSDEREYSGNSLPPNATEPRTMPDITASTRRDREIWSGPTVEQSPRQPAAAYPDIENPVKSPQKRKRSLSVDESAHRLASAQQTSSDQLQQQQQQQQQQPQYGPDTMAIAAAAVAARGASRDGELDRPHSTTEQRDPYNLPRSRDYSARSAENDELQRGQRDLHQRGQQRVELWYPSSQQPSREDRPSVSAYEDARYTTGASSMQSPADDQPGSDPHQHDRSAGRDSGSPQSEYAGRTPDEDDRPSSMPAGHSPSQQRRDPTTLQHGDPKRRKRNFSNRTKTGCLTCRKRKKKCDETKPECSNCVRGGFICAGYPPQKGQWGKIELPKTTVQIESKDPTYVPPGAYGMPRISALDSQPGAYQQQRREQQPPYRGPTLRIEPPQGRPLQSDDDRTATTMPSSIAASPENNKLSAIYAAPAAFPTPVSANTTVPFMDRTPKEYQRVPPLHDLSRNEPETPQHSSPLTQLNIRHSDSPVQQQRSPPQHQLHHPSQHPQSAPQHSQQPAQQSVQQPPLQPVQPSVQQPSQPPVQLLHQHVPQHHQPPLQQQKQAHHVLQHQPPQHGQEQHAVHVHQHRPSFPHQYNPHHLTQQQQEPSPIEQPHRIQHRPYSPPPAMQQQAPPVANEDGGNHNTNDNNRIGSGETRPRPRRNVPFFNTIPGARRERDEMYAGRPFFPFDKELVAERERCSAACWKFNNSMNPNVGVSLSERTRLFKEILQPRDELQMSPIAHTGSVGDQVIVEAPFHADYGYNITIGEDVYIGRNCHISDAMPVSIGNRVYIGPNVSFYTTTLPTDHTQREGVHSAIHGRGITIGDDVFIGGNVTILAGVNIGHGTTVGAGSVVSTVT